LQVAPESNNQRTNPSNFDQLTEIFGIDENIRYIGVFDKYDVVLFSRTREGIASKNADEALSTYPPLILRAAERMRPMFGDVQGIGIHYRNLLLALYLVNDTYVIVSLNPVPIAPLLTFRIGEEIRRILHD